MAEIVISLPVDWKHSNAVGSKGSEEEQDRELGSWKYTVT